MFGIDELVRFFLKATEILKMFLSLSRKHCNVLPASRSVLLPQLQYQIMSMFYWLISLFHGFS